MDLGRFIIVAVCYCIDGIVRDHALMSEQFLCNHDLKGIPRHDAMPVYRHGASGRREETQEE